MIKLFKITVGALVAVLAIWALNQMPLLLSRIDAFEVSAVRLEGARYAQLSDLEAHLSLSPEATIWDDPGPWIERLKAHPLVEEVKIGRRLMGTLVLEVTEPSPVAFVPAPMLEPVDGEGRLLPIDPSLHRLDLPVIHDRWVSGPASGFVTEELRVLAREIARFNEIIPEFAALVTEAHFTDSGDLNVRIGDPSISFLLPRQAGAERIWDGLRVLDYAFKTMPDRPLLHVDLRYADQVIVGLSEVGDQ